MIKRNGKIKLKQKLPSPTSRDNGIKTDVVVVMCNLINLNLYLIFCFLIASGKCMESREY